MEVVITCFEPTEDCCGRGSAFPFDCGVDCLSIRILSSGEPCTLVLRISADAGLDMLQVRQPSTDALLRELSVLSNWSPMRAPVLLLESFAMCPMLSLPMALPLRVSVC